MTKRSSEQVWVVLRADLFQGPGSPPEVLVTAKEVVRSQELADREVARLNALHADGSVRYWWQVSRLFAPGETARSLLPNDEESRAESQVPPTRDIEVELRFVPTAEGGRKGPAFSGYRPQFYYDGRDWDAVHEYPDVRQVHPGDTVRAYLRLPSPQKHVGKLQPGKLFQCREGARVVAEGRIIRILDLEESAQRMLAVKPPQASE